MIELFTSFVCDVCDKLSEQSESINFGYVTWVPYNYTIPSRYSPQLCYIFKNLKEAENYADGFTVSMVSTILIIKKVVITSKIKFYGYDGNNINYNVYDLYDLYTAIRPSAINNKSDIYLVPDE